MDGIALRLKILTCGEKVQYTDPACILTLRYGKAKGHTEEVRHDHM